MMPQPMHQSAGPRHNLPAEVASFIGREREVDELLASLPHVRLLTLTGTGGSGKTRLALRILATSREPLRVPGEVVRRVPSLAQPEPGRGYSPEELGQVEAAALFLDRGRARQPTFLLTAENAPEVISICRRLDGLPLAIELAAAQLDVLTAHEIADRPDDALRLLSGGSRTQLRQETLRDAHTYTSCSGNQSVLLPGETPGTLPRTLPTQFGGTSTRESV